MRALIYDVHGNVLALEAVLEDVHAAGANRFLLGGDYGLFGPWPEETVATLRGLPDATWIRGNVDRWTARRDSVIAKLPVGWFHVGPKKDVPKNACYVARCHGACVWVTPDGLEGLTRLTLIVMDIATIDPDPAPTKTVETYYYDEKNRLSKVVKQVVPADTDGAATPPSGALKRRREFHNELRNLLQFRQGG